MWAFLSYLTRAFTGSGGDNAASSDSARLVTSGDSRADFTSADDDDHNDDRNEGGDVAADEERDNVIEARRVNGDDVENSDDDDDDDNNDDRRALTPTATFHKHRSKSVHFERPRCSTSADVYPSRLTQSTTSRDVDTSRLQEGARSRDVAGTGGRQRAATADVIEICVGEEEHITADDGKTKKKPMRKRVRKRAWKLMRTSFKYVRRGMRSYSGGLASMFTWGINIQQATTTTFGKTNK